jgi:microcystin-dependent protein
MANLSLTANWNAGIYQLETSDPVQGGPGGISNLQPKQLGDRTEWLKEKVDDLLAGNVQMKSVFAYSSNQTLTIDNTGGLVVITGTSAVTLTLPDVTDADALANGQGVFIKNNNSTFNGCFVQTYSGDGTSFDNGNTSIKLNQEDTILIVRDGSTYYAIQIKERGVPAGTIIMYGGNAIPDGYLICDGSIRLKTTWPALFSAIGSTYNQGSVPSNSFMLPDLRGQFVRGLDLNRGIDPSRTLGSSQADTIKDHSHVMTTSQVNYTDPLKITAVDGTGLISSYSSVGETRPKNVALYYLIKA